MRIPYKRGPSWTTDGFYRVTMPEVNHYQKEGVLCVEMESAAIFSVARYRKAAVIALFAIMDSYADLTGKKTLHYEEKKIEILIMK